TVLSSFPTRRSSDLFVLYPCLPICSRIEHHRLKIVHGPRKFCFRCFSCLKFLPQFHQVITLFLRKQPEDPLSRFFFSFFLRLLGDRKNTRLNSIYVS